MEAIIYIILCVFNSLGIAVFMARSLHNRRKEFILYFSLAFIADFVTPGIYEGLTFPLTIIMFIPVLIYREKKSVLDALLTAATTVIYEIFGILLVTGVFMIWMPDFVGTVTYDLLIAVLQAAVMIVCAALVAYWVDLVLPHKAKKLIVFGELFLIGIYTLILPTLFYLLNNSKEMKILYGVNGFLSVVMIAVITVLTGYLCVSERRSLYRKLKLRMLAKLKQKDCDNKQSMLQQNLDRWNAVFQKRNKSLDTDIGQAVIFSQQLEKKLIDILDFYLLYTLLYGKETKISIQQEKQIILVQCSALLIRPPDFAAKLPDALQIAVQKAEKLSGLIDMNLYVENNKLILNLILENWSKTND